MSYQELLPKADIADSVKCLWSISRTYTAENSLFEILPDCFCEIIFYHGAPCYVIQQNNRIELPNPFLIGLLDSPLHFNAVGQIIVVAARIYPWATAELAQILKPDATTFALLQQYLTTGNITSALIQLSVLVDGFLKEKKPDTRIALAGQLLTQNYGTVKPETLAGFVSISLRSLQRLFHAATGQSVKAFARKLRFERIRDRIWNDPDIQLTQLAYEFDFFDQAHLNHEFRCVSNKTPGDFAKEALAAKKVMREQSVVFLQGATTWS